MVFAACLEAGPVLRLFSPLLEPAWSVGLSSEGFGGLTGLELNDGGLIAG